MMRRVFRIAAGLSFVLKKIVLVAAAGAALAACGAGQDPFKVTRSACPAAAILQNTGDVTLFSPAGSYDADAIDVTATITNLRSTCSDTGPTLVSGISFDVVGLRRNTSGARDVTLPYFAAVVRAGSQLVAKQAGSVTLRFADGQARAQASATARSDISRAAVTLPEETRKKITRERKAGDADAAIDPMAEPAVREAVRNATFEVLVGFQLEPGALAYNVGK